MKLLVPVLTFIMVLSPSVFSQSEDLSAIESAIPSGSYSLKKGDKKGCPQGDLIYSQKSKRLIFGTSLSFDLSKLGRSSAEQVPQGCKYRRLTSFKDSVLRRVIKMSNCPIKKENGALVQKIKLQKKKLTFTSEKNNRSVLTCEYERESN